MRDKPITAPNPATTEEVIEGRPWWKVCCVGCVVFVIVAVLAVVLIVRLSPGAGPRLVSTLPDAFPNDVVLYRPEAIREIYHYPAESKHRALRFFYAPFQAMGKDAKKLPELMQTGLKGVTDTDTVTINWASLDATPDEIARFYAGSMIQAGIEEPQMRRTDQDGTVIEMTGSRTGLSYRVVLFDDAETPAVDTVTVIVEYPSPTSQK